MGGGIKLVHALERREVGLDGFDRHAERMEVLRSIVDGRLIGGDQQIETMVGAAFGQLVANAGRSARDDGEWTCGKPLCSLLITLVKRCYTPMAFITKQALCQHGIVGREQLGKSSTKEEDGAGSHIERPAFIGRLTRQVGPWMRSPAPLHTREL